MSAPVLVPRGMAARKPPHGAPCNQCGVCCVASLCRLGTALFGAGPGPCPALILDGENALCGVALAPRAFALAAVETDAELTASALLVIGSGYGCDCRINGEPINHAFNAKLDRLDIQRARQIAEANRIWKIPTRNNGGSYGC